MSSEANKVRIRRSIEAFNRRDIEGFFDAFAPTCIFHEPPIEVPATLEEEKQRIPRTFATFPDLQIVLEDLIAEGEKVVVRYTYRGTDAQTGKKVAWTGISFLYFADGKVIEDWAITDALGLLQQVNAIPNIEQNK
jgi:predicted ester cyclase